MPSLVLDSGGVTALAERYLIEDVAAVYSPYA